MKVKISAAGARHLFACSLEYITGTCKGRCCVGGTKLLVSLLPEEAAWQEAQGFPTKDGLIMPAKNGLCPHKKPDGLCRIHGTGHKPFGCIASPFTLNHSDTLIVRHRYYNLKCHGSGTPAYVAFRASLDLIFGEKEAGRICDHLAKSDQDITAEMPAASYKALHGLDTIKKAKKSGSPPAPPARKEKEEPVTKIEHNIAAGLLPLAVDINSLSEDPRNARVHPEENLKAIMRSLTYYGQRKPIVVNETDRVIEAGNGLFLAARELGWTKIAAVMVKDDPSTAEGFAIMDNQSALLSEWNLPLLKDLLIELDTGSFDMDLTGFSSQAIEDLMTTDGLGGSGSGGGMTKDQARVTLAERFIVPPFTVLDTRQGYWRDRAQAWQAIGVCGEYSEETQAIAAGSPAAETNKVKGLLMKSDSGNDPGYYFKKQEVEARLGHKITTKEFQDKYYNPQGDNVAGVFTQSGFGNDPSFYTKKEAAEKKIGHALTNAEFVAQFYQPPDAYKSGNSSFDPVLCELVFRWFCPPRGRVLDPYGGESTKGLVAAYLGLDYTGVEIRPEQVAVNDKNAAALGLKARWITGDSQDIGKLIPQGDDYDLIFTSPPYYNLENYQGGTKDISTAKTYKQFMAGYGEIFKAAVDHLKANRFLVVKVSEIRAKGGEYYGFVPDNERLFENLGLKFYNEAILVNAVGSLAIRVGRQFAAGRKLGRVHQNVLIYYKGKIDAIKKEFPETIEYADLSIEEENPIESNR